MNISILILLMCIYCYLLNILFIILNKYFLSIPLGLLHGAILILHASIYVLEPFFRDLVSFSWHFQNEVVHNRCTVYMNVNVEQFHGRNQQFTQAENE